MDFDNLIKKCEEAEIILENVYNNLNNSGLIDVDKNTIWQDLLKSIKIRKQEIEFLKRIDKK